MASFGRKLIHRSTVMRRSLIERFINDLLGSVVSFDSGEEKLNERDKRSCRGRRERK